MAVVSISMPDELLRRIDGFADEHGYTGRSEVFREAARDLLGEFEDRRLEDRELMGVVTVLFDYETTSVEERMMSLRHEHEYLVASKFPQPRRRSLLYGAVHLGWHIRGDFDVRREDPGHEGHHERRLLGDSGR